MRWDKVTSNWFGLLFLKYYTRNKSGILTHVSYKLAQGKQVICKGSKRISCNIYCVSRLLFSFIFDKRICELPQRIRFVLAIVFSVKKQLLQWEIEPGSGIVWTPSLLRPITVYSNFDAACGDYLIIWQNISKFCFLFPTLFHVFLHVFCSYIDRLQNNIITF